METVRSLLSLRTSEDWSIFSIYDLIVSRCQGARKPRAVLFGAIDWLLQEWPHHTVLVPTSPGLATLNTTSVNEEDHVLRRYYRHANGPYISHIRVHKDVNLIPRRIPADVQHASEAQASEALARQLEQVDEVGYRKSLQKGRRIISFVLQEDAQVELVYAGAIAARAEVLITGDGYLFHTVNLIHNPSGRARYEAIQRHLEGLTAGSLPVARDCNQL